MNPSLLRSLPPDFSNIVNQVLCSDYYANHPVNPEGICLFVVFFFFGPTLFTSTVSYSLYVSITIILLAVLIHRRQSCWLQ